MGHGQVGNQPSSPAIWVHLDGHKDILGIWPGQGGWEPAKYWLAVLTDLKNRDDAGAFFLICDGPDGLSDARPPC